MGAELSYQGDANRKCFKCGNHFPRLYGDRERNCPNCRAKVPPVVVVPGNTIEFRQIKVLRSCFRCGREFSRVDGDRICPRCRAPKQGTKPLNPKLSFREKQVVLLVSQAKLNKEIAHELHLTEGTIKEYLNRIFRKISVTNRTELAVWALTHSWQTAEEQSASII